jgi:hypothetical protein
VARSLLTTILVVEKTPDVHITAIGIVRGEVSVTVKIRFGRKKVEQIWSNGLMWRKEKYFFMHVLNAEIVRHIPFITTSRCDFGLGISVMIVESVIPTHYTLVKLDINL